MGKSREEMTRTEETLMFGNFIKELRTQKKMTLAQVAEKLNVSSNYISQLERGVRRITDDMIRELSMIYEIDEDVLFRKSGRIPLRVMEEIQNNPMLQKALSFVSKKKISDKKKREMEEEILRVYTEFLNVHKEEILKEEYAVEIGVYDLVVITDRIPEKRSV